MSSYRNAAVVLGLLLSLESLPHSLAPGSETGSQTTTGGPGKASSASVDRAAHTPDTPDLVRETQLRIAEPGYAGLVWWVPFEFFTQAGLSRGTAAEKTAESLGFLKQYTVVMVFAAQPKFGGFDFVSPRELQKKVVVRDAVGNDYTAIPEPSLEAQNITSRLKEMLTSGMGKGGENSAVLFFPARGKGGEVIADAHATGTFSVVLRDVVGVPESIYTWRLPLTTVMSPRYCPLGKERLNANWEYCPWHGVKLEPPKP